MRGEREEEEEEGEKMVNINNPKRQIFQTKSSFTNIILFVITYTDIG